MRAKHQIIAEFVQLGGSVHFYPESGITLAIGPSEFDTKRPIMLAAAVAFCNPCDNWNDTIGAETAILRFYDGERIMVSGGRQHSEIADDLARVL